MPKFLAMVIACMSLFSGSYSVVAGPNPFKKTKNYNFNDSIAWYLKESAAVKSGDVREGSDALYYHLNINKDRLRLRLGKNDPSGELENTINLSKMEISDVLIDGRRMARFQWCLDNQERPGKKLKQNAVVINDTCVNAGGGGDFIINLDKASLSSLKQAKKVEFIVEPYGRPVKLSYSMAGFADIMAQIEKPAPPVIVKKPAPKPQIVAKPKPRPKPKPKKVVIEMCQAQPPADFKNAIKAETYPCKDTVKKAAAEKRMASNVAKEKQKMAAEMEKLRKEQEIKQASAESIQREKEWEQKQAAMWISRCQKHWAKGVSPCYCEKYMDQAPSNVSNTCGR
ncbi:MAG: hypothetical protein OQL06_14915 [Gammaproteobacteria bacterium]|nr:hypothetical protein [Gammaproteobacteria bacterium]